MDSFKLYQLKTLKEMRVKQYELLNQDDVLLEKLTKECDAIFKGTEKYHNSEHVKEVNNITEMFSTRPAILKELARLTEYIDKLSNNQ
jgi:hypothetical protein